jgi:hypothetical protein
MPHKGLLLLSLGCALLSVLFFLFPGAISGANRFLNQTLASLDEPLMRYRYLFGALLAVAAYCIFRVALLVPGVGS